MATKMKLTIEVWETGKYEEVESSSTETNLEPVTSNDELRENLICLLLGYGLEDAREYLKKVPEDKSKIGM